KFYVRTGTARPSSARIITLPIGKPAFPVRLIAGQAAKGLIIFTASSVARRTNGHRPSTAIRPRSKWKFQRAWKAAIRLTIRWRTRSSNTSARKNRRRRIVLSSFITLPAQHMLRITSQSNGLRNSKANSIRVGTSTARKHISANSNLASSQRMPNLRSDQKKFRLGIRSIKIRSASAARLMETFAAYTAQTDYEVGRILDALRHTGQLDNTLVIWEIGDNGASMEGTFNGVFNEMSSLNGVPEDTSYVVKHIEEIGGPGAYNHFPVGWAWAMNTPFQWGKQIASHFGGTRNPVVISWPNRIKDKGGVRTQFHHVIDIVPTILEAAQVTAPTELNGVKQKPIEGVSMMYSFDDAKAKEQRPTQYFEMFGNRALYHEGWIAVCRHGRLPWENAGSYDFDKDTWELYNVEQDFSEANDVAAQNRDKLKELQDLFLVEAKKYNVLPLDDRFAERADPSLRPSLIEGKTSFTYYAGATRIPESSSANVKNRSHTIVATIEMPKQGGDGVLVAAGGLVGGYAFYVKGRRPVYEYNWFSQARYKVTSSQPLPEGPATIRVDFVSDGGVGKGGK